MDDFNGEFEDYHSEFEYNVEGNSIVPSTLEYLISNLNMITAISKVTGGMVDKITFYIKPPGNFDNGDNNNDDDQGGIPPSVKPLPPKRPVEFELEA